MVKLDAEGLVRLNGGVCVEADLVTPVEKTQMEPAQSNQSWLMVKEAPLPVGEPLEKNGQESKFTLHPPPSAVWPKHADLAPVLRHHSLHNKSKKALKSDRLQEHNGEKLRQALAPLPKAPPGGTAASATAAVVLNADRKTNQDAHSSVGAPPQGEQSNLRPRAPPQPQQPTPPPRRELPTRRLNPEENRPGKSGAFQPFAGAEGRNGSGRLPAAFNRRSSSLAYQFDLLRRGRSKTSKRLAKPLALM